MIDFISDSFKKLVPFLEGYGIMNTKGLLQSKWSPKGFTYGCTLTLQETRSIHDSMNLPKIELLFIFTFYYK